MKIDGSVILLLFLNSIGSFYIMYVVINRDKFVNNTRIIDLTHKRLFDSYLNEFNKKYDNKEYLKRLENFRESLEEISRLNRDQPPSSDPARYGLTQFSDMSNEDFRKSMLMDNDVLGGGCTPLEKECREQNFGVNESVSIEPIPAKIDWRKRGAVGPVLIQDGCNNCWAISIVSNMESMVFIQKLDRYTRLSVQELTDCTTTKNPCRGGNVAAALKYLCSPSHDLAITTENKYPYIGYHQHCMKYYTKGVKLSNMTVECDLDAKQIKELLARRPVIVVVDSYNWKNYLGGIIQAHCSGTWENLNHVVQLVGYDTTGDVPYFLAKNSWGTKFGDGGYVKIAMGNFNCGIGREVSYFRVYID